MTPGLRKWEIIESTSEDYCYILETWDVTVKGCPVVVLNLPNFKKDDAITVTRTYKISREQLKDIG